MAAAAVDRVLQLDPGKVLAENNLRYSVLKADVDALKSSIKESGGVQVPVEVTLLDPPVNGFSHSLTTGFRRHQAVSELNKEEGAGLTLPAIVRPLDNDLDRINHQLVENIERKSMSPMDTAVALEKLMALGLSRIQIRERFARQSGKGGKLEPASNAWLNMTLSFLQLPKAIQHKIHDGSVGVKAAYELTKVSPEKRAAVLQRAEEDMEKEREREQKEEEKYLAAEAKVVETTKQAEETAVKMDEARAEVELAQKAYDAKLTEASEAYQKAQKAKKEDKKAATEAHKAKETDAKAAEKALETANKALAKLADDHKKVTDKAAEHRAKLEAARAQGATGKGKKAAGVTDTAVKKAAAAEGEGGVVQLNAAEMRKVIADLALPGTYPKVQMIGEYIKACFDGKDTPGQMLKKLASVTGELAAKAARTPKAAK
jgi:hypothetical protein